MIGCDGRRGGLASLVVALVAVACGGSAEPVDGADTDRSPQPDMELVTFADVAGAVGLDFRHGAFQWDTRGDVPAMMGGGVCWIDYDSDGWLDLFAVNTWSDGEWGRWRQDGGLPTSRLYRNNRGTFTDVTDSTGAGLEIRGTGCVAADLDGDGHTDLYVTSDRANALLWNDGGAFVDGSTGSGADASGWHGGAAAGDLNGDGRLDLYVAGYTDLNRSAPGATRGFPNSFEPEPDLVLVNEGAAGDGRPTFRDVATDVGVESEGADYSLGAVMSDVDADGDLDVYLANDTRPNRLYLNRPDATSSTGFRLDEVGQAAGVADDNAGMGVAAGDYDTDGQVDLAVTNHESQVHNLFRQAGPGPVFADALTEVGVPRLAIDLTGWGTNWIDADLDGDLDLVAVHGHVPVTDLEADREPVRLYENDLAVGSFVDVSAEVGLDRVGPYLGRGSAAADYDNDGDVDVAVGTIGGDLALLRNGGAGGHWLMVAPDPALPGTVVTVRAGGVNQRREVLAGSSYLSSEDPRAHFGLGQADSGLNVKVRWPDGVEWAVDDPAADQILNISHDDAVVDD